MTPLPLLDGVFLIDNSSIEKWKCPRLWEYSELRLRSAVAEKAGANFGSTLHRGLETRYQLAGANKLDDAAVFTCETAMREWLNENPQPPGDFRDFNHACRMLRVYNQIYPLEAFKILTSPTTGKPIIEASFALPFAIYYAKEQNLFFWTQDHDKPQDIVDAGSIPIYYCGKIDLGIEDSNGIWSFDHKTTFQFGETFSKQMAMDGGQLGYCWALGQVLGRQPQGYIIDAIRVRRPSVKQGVLGESPIDATDFTRTPYYVSQADIDEWKKDTLEILRSIFAAHANGHFPRHRWHCTNKFGVCEFYDVCSTPLSQRDLILESGLFEQNKWTKGLRVNVEN